MFNHGETQSDRMEVKFFYYEKTANGTIKLCTRDLCSNE